MSWDVIRVLAMLSVVVQHATHTVRGVLPFLAAAPFDYGIEAGANTLMVVSAYFVCETLARRAALGWWWNRIARLLPAYLVAVLVTYAATLLAAQHGYWHPALRDLLGNLLLAQSWHTGVVSMDGSYWTLPLQLGVFTLAASAVLVVGPRAGLWRSPPVLPVMAWTATVIPVVVTAVDAGPVRLLADGLVMSRWPLFGIGLAMWAAGRGRMGVGHLVAVTTAGLSVQYSTVPDPWSTVALAAACAAIGWAALAPQRSWLPDGRVRRAVSWLAGIAYGVYLLNQQLGYFLAWILESVGVTGWARLVVVVTAAIGAGWILTVLVERPSHSFLTGGRRAASRTATRRPPAPAVGASPSTSQCGV